MERRRKLSTAFQAQLFGAWRASDLCADKSGAGAYSFACPTCAGELTILSDGAKCAACSWEAHGKPCEVAAAGKAAKSKTPNSGQRAVNPFAHAAETNAPLIEFLSPSQLAAYVPPNGARLIGDFHVTRGAVFVIGGAPGVGKSRAMTALAIAGATGADWLGLPLHRQFKTMIVQNENGRFRLKTEFAGVDCSALEPWVRVCPPPPRGLCFGRSEFREQLAAAIAEFTPDVIGLDPWNAAAQNDQAKDYLETFDLIRSVIPAGDDAPALGIVAHTRKPKADERASGRGLLNLLAGSYVLGSVPRSVFVMQAATDATDDARVVWTCCKNNDGEMGARSAWIRSNGLFSPAQGFDWDSFDNPARDKMPKHKQVVEIVATASAPMTKAAIVAALKTRGVSQASAYRWIECAVNDGDIEYDKIAETYHANSQ